jgi:hypothetical protein
MTPKGKAEELIEKFKKVELYHSMEPTDFDCQIKHISSASYTAKECALIAVDEICEILEDNGFTFIEYHDRTTIEYWLQVKQEIKTSTRR